MKDDWRETIRTSIEFAIFVKNTSLAYYHKIKLQIMSILIKSVSINFIVFSEYKLISILSNVHYLESIAIIYYKILIFLLPLSALKFINCFDASKKGIIEIYARERATCWHCTWCCCFFLLGLILIEIFLMYYVSMHLEVFHRNFIKNVMQFSLEFFFSITDFDTVAVIQNSNIPDWRSEEIAL